MALVDVKYPFVNALMLLKNMGAVMLDTSVTAVGHAVVLSSLITHIASAGPV